MVAVDRQTAVKFIGIPTGKHAACWSATCCTLCPFLGLFSGLPTCAYWLRACVYSLCFMVLRAAASTYKCALHAKNRVVFGTGSWVINTVRSLVVAWYHYLFNACWLQYQYLRLGATA